MQTISPAISVDEVVVYTSRHGEYSAEIGGKLLLVCSFWEYHEHVLVMKEGKHKALGVRPTSEEEGGVRPAKSFIWFHEDEQEDRGTYRGESWSQLMSAWR
jgi:hypothetical protein